LIKLISFFLDFKVFFAFPVVSHCRRPVLVSSFINLNFYSLQSAGPVTDKHLVSQMLLTLLRHHLRLRNHRSVTKSRQHALFSRQFSFGRRRTFDVEAQRTSNLPSTPGHSPMCATDHYNL